VEGLQVKAIRLDEFTLPAGITLTDNNRRNLLAHWCYGSWNLSNLSRNPFSFGLDYSGLVSVNPADLTACDLPLAVFYWTGNRLNFVDMWSVRRRLVRPDGLVDAWKGVLSERRVADGQARFLQFQDQLSTIPVNNNTRAVDYFYFLPPVGFLPVTPDSTQEKLSNLRLHRGQLVNGLDLFKLIAAKKPTGFNLFKFFEGISLRLGLIAGETLDFTLHRSWYDEPFETVQTAKQPRIQLYLVEDNLIDAASPLYIMFVKSLRPIVWLDSFGQVNRQVDK
jgi:hypothetical protein